MCVSTGGPLLQLRLGGGGLKLVLFSEGKEEMGPRRGYLGSRRLKSIQATSADLILRRFGKGKTRRLGRAVQIRASNSVKAGLFFSFFLSQDNLLPTPTFQQKKLQVFFEFQGIFALNLQSSVSERKQ